MSIIGIVLGVIAIGLIFWFNKDQQRTNELVEFDIDQARIISELEKQLEIKSKNQDKKMEKHFKELPSIIGRVVGQIEFAQDKINRQM